MYTQSNCGHYRKSPEHTLDNSPHSSGEHTPERENTPEPTDSAFSSLFDPNNTKDHDSLWQSERVAEKLSSIEDEDEYPHRRVSPDFEDEYPHRSLQRPLHAQPVAPSEPFVAPNRHTTWNAQPTAPNKQQTTSKQQTASKQPTPSTQQTWSTQPIAPGKQPAWIAQAAAAVKQPPWSTQPAAPPKQSTWSKQPATNKQPVAPSNQPTARTHTTNPGARHSSVQQSKAQHQPFVPTPVGHFRPQRDGSAQSHPPQGPIPAWSVPASAPTPPQARFPASTRSTPASVRGPPQIPASVRGPPQGPAFTRSISASVRGPIQAPVSKSSIAASLPRQQKQKTAPPKNNVRKTSILHTLVICSGVLSALAIWYLYGFWGYPSVFVVWAAMNTAPSEIPGDGELFFVVAVCFVQTISVLYLFFPLWYMCMVVAFLYFYFSNDSPRMHEWGGPVFCCWNLCNVSFTWYFFGFWSLYPLSSMLLLLPITWFARVAQRSNKNL